METAGGKIMFMQLDESALGELARNLSLQVRPGDYLALEGDLGTGKTSFARYFISALHDKESAGDEAQGILMEIPSPTFTICQDYSTGRVPVFHYDFYRLGEPDEVLELGLDEALERAVVLAEWSEKIAPYVPADRLEIRLDMSAGQPERRDVQLVAYGAWQARLECYAALENFLQGCGWQGARRSFLQGDASARRYLRLYQAGEVRILMDAPKMPDGPPIREGLPYSRIAHLAEDIVPFVAVAGALSGAGLRVPRIYDQDFAHGFILLEDLGDRVLGREVAHSPDQLQELYEGVLPVLGQLASLQPPRKLPLPGGTCYQLPRYDLSAMLIEAELVLDWMYPALHEGQEASEEVRENYLSIWRHLLEEEARSGQHWVLRDFHSPNLLLLEDGDPVQRIGIIDFQDAMIGPVGYDVASLFQDARLDIPASLQIHLLESYCEMRGRLDTSFDKDAFLRSYTLMGAQRCAKILGIFVRLAKRDGKTAYIQHIPRISAYLEVHLRMPFMSDLKVWFDTCLPPAQRVQLDRFQGS